MEREKEEMEQKYRAEEEAKRRMKEEEEAAARCQFHEHFSYKFFVQMLFSLVTFGFVKKFVRKIRVFNVDEIDGRWQFHQQFTRAFCINIFVLKDFKAKMLLEKSCAKHNCMKNI